MIKPFHELTGTARQGRVNEFRVWRAARAADWDCTARELARETGLHVTTVRKICDRRGWSHMLADGQGGRIRRARGGRFDEIRGDGMTEAEVQDLRRDYGVMQTDRNILRTLLDETEAKMDQMHDKLQVAEARVLALRARVATLEQTVDGIWRYAVDTTVADHHFRGWAEVEARAVLLKQEGEE